MITITQQGDELILRAHYEYRHRLAKIPNAWFDYDRKAWITHKNFLPFIENEFQGEIYFKTPRWKILGQEPPKAVHDLYFKPAEVPNINATLFNYQVDGYQFMVDRIDKYGFVLNADLVGLGKTVQSIATMLHYNEDKVLVIAKKSIKTQWKEEIQRFCPNEQNIFVTGETKKKRMDAYKGITDADKGILVTNYHNFLTDSEIINGIDFGLVIIDEVHQVKARKGKMNNNIRSVARGKKTILLTGTPIMSKPEDIFGIVGLVGDYFGKYSEFQKRYLVVEYGIYGFQIIGAKNLDELQWKIKDFMIRRTVDDANVDIPEELPPVKINADMDSVQKKMKAHIDAIKQEIDDKKRELLDKFKGGNIPDEVMMEIENINEKSKMFIPVSQFIADDPMCFKYIKGNAITNEVKAFLTDSYTMSAKTEATVELVESIIDADEKVIIFTHFATPARLLKNVLEKKLKTEAVLYTGSENDAQRDANIKAFKEGDVNILIGTEAMAEGLNLQVAQYIIHYEQPDTWAAKEQRIGRIKRIGSKHEHITSYDICTDGSFDYVRLGKLKKDRLLAGAMIDA